MRELENIRCTRFCPEYVGLMDWQQPVSLVIVGVAAAALIWGRARRRKSFLKRGVTCLCPAAGRASNQPEILFHARKNNDGSRSIKIRARACADKKPEIASQ